MDEPSQDRLESAIRSIDESSFGEFVATVWDERGWKTELVSQADGRTDILATDDETTTLIRTLDDGRTIGGNEVRRLLDDGIGYNDLKYVDMDAAIIVSTGRSTETATTPPGGEHLDLVDGERLVEIVRREGILNPVLEFGVSRDQSTDGLNATFEADGV